MAKRVAGLLVVLCAFTGCDVIRELQSAQWSESAPDPPADPDVDSARVSMTFRPIGREKRVPAPWFGTVEAEIVRGGAAISYTLDLPEGAGDGVRGPDLGLLLDGDTVYWRPYAYEESLPQGKFWFSMTWEKLRDLLPGLSEPVRLLRDGGVLTKFRLPLDGGVTRVRGVKTIRYVRPEGARRVAAIFGIPPDRVDELRQAAPAARRFAHWLDLDGFVRRLEFPLQQRVGGPLVICTMDVYDHGAPLTLQFPPEQDVAEYDGEFERS